MCFWKFLLIFRYSHPWNFMFFWREIQIPKENILRQEYEKYQGWLKRKICRKFGKSVEWISYFDIFLDQGWPTRGPETNFCGPIHVRNSTIFRYFMCNIISQFFTINAPKSRIFGCGLNQRRPTRGPSTFSRNRPFREKSTKSLKFSENLALGLIWVGRRGPKY
jgi:hypothetical protein